MKALLGLAPCVAVIVAVLVLRWSALTAAASASLAALALWITGAFATPGLVVLRHAVADAAVLGLLVAAVIVPGMLFVEIGVRLRSPHAIASLLRTLDLSPARAAVLLCAGVGVLLESLTGFGVSLLVTVPLLLAIASRPRAIGLALVGMSLMPWGALGISAHLGAGLAGLTVASLAEATWRLGGPVAALLPALCLVFVPDPSRADRAFAIAAGALLCGAIGVATWTVGIELAGICGGLAVIGLALTVASRGDGFRDALASPALRPYAILIVAVLAQKLALWLTDASTGGLTVSTGRVAFSVPASPGIALIAASALAIAAVPGHERAAGALGGLGAALARRAWRPLLGIGLFLFAARLLEGIGAIDALAGLVGELGPRAAALAVAALGAVSGYVTGGGLAGNALFMASAAATGAQFAAVDLFAALQNAAAGHVAMSSLPVAAVLVAALPSRDASDERIAMQTGLALAALYVLILSLGAVVQLAVNG